MTESESVQALRSFAVAAVEYACGYEQGRSKDDPVYDEVTEGRDGPSAAIREGYSSCGDLAHWLLERMGIREPWVNRNVTGYRVGMNPSELAFDCPHAINPVKAFARGGEPLGGIDAGDIIIVWNHAQGHDAHVMVCLDRIRDGVLRTANYGAGGMSGSAWPGARLGSAPVVGDRYGSKRIQRVISVRDLDDYAGPVDVRGLSLDGETLDVLDEHFGLKNSG